MDFKGFFSLFKNQPTQALEVETVTTEATEPVEGEIIVTVRYGLTPHQVPAKQGQPIHEVVAGLAKKLGLTMTADTVITNVESGEAVELQAIVEQPVEVDVKTTAGING
jgi:hypothetical protein